MLKEGPKSAVRARRMRRIGFCDALMLASPESMILPEMEHP